MRQEEEERGGGGLTAILRGTPCVVNADYSIPPRPSLQTYRCSMTPSTPTPTPSIFLPSVSPTLHLIYFRWSSNMKLWRCRCDLWLQHPTTPVSHNSSLHPPLSLPLSLRLCIYLFIYQKNDLMWRKDGAGVALMRLQHPTLPVSHNLSF